MKATSRYVSFAIVLAAVLVAGCSPQPQVIQVTATQQPTPTATPTPQVTVEQVSLVAEDGFELAGSLYRGEGDTAVVLAHMGSSDQTSWQPFARLVAGRGMTVLTFDFRCFGLSTCPAAVRESVGDLQFSRDMLGAIQFLRDQGFERIICMGASMGGIACANATMQEELIGFAAIASPLPARISTQSYPENMMDPDIPKLFILAEDDPSELTVAEMPLLVEISPEPKEYHVLPGNVHGTDLFDTEQADAFRDLLLGFLDELR